MNNKIVSAECKCMNGSNFVERKGLGEGFLVRVEVEGKNEEGMKGRVDDITY